MSVNVGVYCLVRLWQPHTRQTGNYEHGMQDTSLAALTELEHLSFDNPKFANLLALKY
jgi:hypothetical protein